MMQNLSLLDISIINELAIKNDPIKTQHHSLFLWKDFT